MKCTSCKKRNGILIGANYTLYGLYDRAEGPASYQIRLCTICMAKVLKHLVDIMGKREFNKFIKEHGKILK